MAGQTGTSTSLAQTIAEYRHRLHRRYRLTLNKRHPNPRPEYDADQMDEAAASSDAQGDFGRLYFAHEGRLCHKYVHYFPVYDQHLARLRERPADRPLRVLEIGVLHGGALQLWRQYFGPDAVLFGIDVDRKSAAVDDPDLNVRIGSQADPDFLRAIVEEMGGVDVVIDDGSHRSEHQVSSFLTLFPMLADGGVYLVEDTHAAYWPEFGGGYRYKTSFIEFAYELVNQMHQWYIRRPLRELPGVDPKTMISGVSFHDSIVVIDKKLHGPATMVKIGERSF